MYLQLLRFLEVLIGLLVNGLYVIEQREVLVFLLDEHGHQSVQVIDVGNSLELLERLLVPLTTGKDMRNQVESKRDGILPGHTTNTCETAFYGL